MISYTQSLITLNGKTEPILRYEVWFQTPFGLVQSVQDGIKQCAAVDFEPDRTLLPVSVAVSESMYEICGR